jgi:hypothetical protein
MAKRGNKSRPDLSASIRSRSPLTIERLMRKLVPRPVLVRARPYLDPVSYN